MSYVYNPNVASMPFSTNNENLENVMPWDEPDFVPRTSSGKQKSPNMIRSELQKYIDSSTETQTAIIDRMGVNSNSFRRFMNPKTYKNQWSATDNGTYWAAARLLAQANYEKKQANKTGKKRAAGEVQAYSNKKSKSQLKLEAEQYIDRINAVQDVDGTVYDSCPQLVTKIKAFLAVDGVTKAMFCRALGNINQNSLNPFLMGKKQDQCGNITYQRAYEFFEKKRLLDGEPKSKPRLKNEQEHPSGFSLVKERQARWVFSGNPYGFY